MNAVHNRVSASRKSWSERIKTWLGTTQRRPATKGTFKPRLESLEVRDVPSTMGVEVASQLQTDMNYLNQTFQQQVATVGKDANVLVQDMLHVQIGRLGADVVQLQTDFIKADQAMIGAMIAVWTGNVPSPTTSNAGHTLPATTSNSSGQQAVHFTPATNTTQNNAGTSYTAPNGGWNTPYNPATNVPNLSTLQSLPPSPEVSPSGGQANGSALSGLMSPSGNYWNNYAQANGGLPALVAQDWNPNGPSISTSENLGYAYPAYYGGGLNGG